jgi:hypothetical protein
MAASITSTQSPKIPLGGVYLQVLNVSFAAVTSGTFTTADHGFTNVVGAWFVNNTSDDHGITKINSDGSSTVRGSVNVSSVTSGDVGQLFILGT